MNINYIGEKLARLRETKGLSQDEFALAMNLKHETIVDWENGFEIDASNLIKIVKYFNITINELFEWNGKYKKEFQEGTSLVRTWDEYERIQKYNNIAFKINANKFKGDAVYCPCCEREFSKFETFEISNRHNSDMYKGNFLDVRCPYCLSLPRHRIVCSILQDYVHKLSEVLLFAPLNNMKIWFNRKKIKWVSADLFDNTADIKVDIQHMPFEYFTFDFISCDHVLEHVIDWKLALSELYRIVKKGGVVEITVPILPELSTTYENNTIISEEERIREFGQSDHMRIFGNDFIDRLEEAGFNVSVIDGNSLSPRIVPFIAPAIYDSNKVFICKK